MKALKNASVLRLSRRSVLALAVMLSVAIALPAFSLPAFAAAEKTAAGLHYYKLGDYTKALEIFTRQTEAGDSTAAFMLGLMYQKGQGTKVNNVAAVKLFRAAAKVGIVPAQQQLGVHYVKGLGVPQDKIAALMWFSIASANGDNQAELLRQEMELRMPTSDVDKALRAASTWMAKNPKAVKR